MSQQSNTRRTPAKRGTQARKPVTTKVGPPSTMYVLANEPVQGVEFTLVPLRARSEIVLVPEVVDVVRRRDEGTGAIYEVFKVQGTTDRGDLVSFKARTVGDDVRLMSMPKFN